MPTGVILLLIIPCSSIENRKKEMKKKVTVPAGKIGIGFAGSPPRINKVSDTSPLQGLVEVGDVISEIIIPGVIELSGGFNATTVSTLLGKYSDNDNRVIVVLSTDSSNSDGFGNHIVLKKTWKMKEYSVSTDKYFTFHGGIDSSAIESINDNLERIRSAGGQQRLNFVLDEGGHYKANMNHGYQKAREEDAIVCIMDSMSALGYKFTRQFDSETASAKVMTGSSYTNKEMWLFEKQ